MDELCRIHSSFDHLYTKIPDENFVHFRESNEVMGCSDMPDFLKDQIANHPLYPNLVSAYIECRKVGAPPEIASLLEEKCKASHHVTSPYVVGADPELDLFMESYCEALVRYKEELLKAFEEATTFFGSIASQLSDLCKESATAAAGSSFTSTNYHCDKRDGISYEAIIYDVEATESQESPGGVQYENEIKERLMRKYSGYLSNLRKEFWEKRKKGKLPKNARCALVDWWNAHFRWPYPTVEEKNKLSEVTGLDQKQINNWFINQRKRHWRSSGDMRFALLQGLAGGINDAGGGAAGSHGSLST